LSGLLNTPVEGLFYRLGGHTGDSNSTKSAATAVRPTGYTSWQWEAPASYRSGDGFCGLLAAGQHAVNQNNGRQPRVADAEMAEAARSVLLLGHLYRTLRCVWTAAPRELRGGKRICRWAVSPGQTGRAPPGAQHPFEKVCRPVTWTILSGAPNRASVGQPRRTIVTWLILPVVICLSQRLSHACLSISNYTAKLRMAHYISYRLFDSTLLLG
jgi:hypothetical protein